MHSNEMAVFGVSESEEKVYRHFLRHPETSSHGIHLVLDENEEQVADAVERLVRLHLLRPGDRPDELIPADPELAVARLTELRLRDMYQEIQRITQSHHVLAELRAETAARDHARSAPGSFTEQGVEELDGREELRGRMEDLVFFAREEIVSVEPGIHLMAEQVGQAQGLEWRALRRGVRRRLVVPRAALHHQPVAGYLRELMARGGRVRVATEMSDQVAVYDRRVALMPQDPKNIEHGALLVRGRALVTTLLGLFEKVWEQAEEVTVELRDPAESQMPELSEAELRVLHVMCVAGKDESGARELGVSVRTYRRHVADVMRRLGASTRAQAALLARERGWL